MPKEISVGTKYASFKTGSIVCKAVILHREIDQDGRHVIYLDRLIHTKPGGFYHYDSSGAISTILTSHSKAV